MKLLVFVLLSIMAQAQENSALTLGNPADSLLRYRKEYILLKKPTYAVVYSRSTNGPVMAMWHLSTAEQGRAKRTVTGFTPETKLPKGWFIVRETDYTNSGYNRGHLCPSEDRTKNSPQNRSTFVLSNVLPQTFALNRGPWASLEAYCRKLTGSGNELYIYAGGRDSLGVIASGKVTVPAFYWKLLYILPTGNDDCQRLATARTVAVWMPNRPGLLSAWPAYTITVEELRRRTGLRFL